MKVLVPVLSKDRNAEVSAEFGRAPYFAVIEGGNVEFYENPGASASGGAGAKASQFVINLGVVATATLKHKHSYTNIAVAFETPLRLCSLSRTFQGNPRGDHRLPFPTCF